MTDDTGSFDPPAPHTSVDPPAPHTSVDLPAPEASVDPPAPEASVDSEPTPGLTGRVPRQTPEPPPRATHGPAKVVAMCNQKGGVGKTTSTINLGAALAEYGRRVLLVDLDPQGALSAGLGVPHYELDNTVHNLLVEPRVSIDEVLQTTRVPGWTWCRATSTCRLPRSSWSTKSAANSHWPARCTRCSTATTTC